MRSNGYVKAGKLGALAQGMFITASIREANKFRLSRAERKELEKEWAAVDAAKDAAAAAWAAVPEEDKYPPTKAELTDRYGQEKADRLWPDRA